MFHRFILKFVLAVIIMLALAMPALAGCCVVITLDELPMQVIAEQPLHVGFMMRFAHMPMGGRTPQITAIRADTHESFSVTAEAQGDAGHYTARLTFPSAGTWNWSIDAVGGFDQPMPTLTVLASAPSSSVNAGVAFSFPLAVGILGLIGAAGALLVSLRRRARWAVALVLAGAVISGAGFASEANSTAVAAPQNQVELGKALFVAKGCVVCHQHDTVTVAQKGFHSFEVGPNLTHLKANPDFLHRWLKDPSAVKPGTFMPTLGLSDNEIEALIAFLSANAE